MFSSVITKSQENHEIFFWRFSPRCPTAGCSRLHSRAQQRPGKLIKCLGCQKKICLEDRLACLRKCEALYERGLTSMNDERVDEAIGTLCDALKRFHEVACPPHRDTHLAEIALSSCLADYGNTWRPAVALWGPRRRRRETAAGTSTDLSNHAGQPRFGHVLRIKDECVWS